MIHLDIGVGNQLYPESDHQYSYYLVIGGSSFSFASPSKDFILQLYNIQIHTQS